MRSGWKIAAIGLLLAGLAGCNRKPQNAALPPQAQAPSRPPAEMAALLPLMPPLPPRSESKPVMLNTATPPETANDNAAAPPRHSRRRSKSAQDTTQPETAKNAPSVPAPPGSTEIASGSPSESSPIGQLSTANNDANAADRQTLTDQINGTENSLNGIHRSLTSDEQKTAMLIRTFIAKARQALKVDDLDGARNYCTKAKILLKELIPQ